jgi:hypothetical protein
MLDFHNCAIHTAPWLMNPLISFGAARSPTWMR